VIDHIGFEISDLARSAAFYDPVFFALGGRRMVESDVAVAYGINAPLFWFVTREPPVAPAPGYGHLALAAAGRAAVDAGYRAGMDNGGRDDGAPGPRPQYGSRYYAAYLLDPDGLSVELVSRR
jgi:catechol 2,3-dioxygenase-like lactoylglutathione lyase family enzyme